MPLPDPVAFATLNVDDLTKLRDQLWQQRGSGVQWRRYADQSGVQYRSDAELRDAIGAIDQELARRAGTATPSTLLVASSKGLCT